MRRILINLSICCVLGQPKADTEVLMASVRKPVVIEPWPDKAM